MVLRYMINIYAQAAITAPTLNSNADLSNCVRTFESSAGAVVRITSTSDQATFYTHMELWFLKMYF